ncbi:hypothetical protein TCON_0820 [Astathelohania contejeani]|uniref:Ricin B lectin domain-containing protein n=1 Tax=Astathelohania contejeani TaxID=164912 RepID=A0ABQ7I0K1_9MICR|nr:hypothetical protein TCON_0820 [Thelohania contejeani]
MNIFAFIGCIFSFQFSDKRITLHVASRPKYRLISFGQTIRFKNIGDRSPSRKDIITFVPYDKGYNMKIREFYICENKNGIYGCKNKSKTRGSWEIRFNPNGVMFINGNGNCLSKDGISKKASAPGFYLKPKKCNNSDDNQLFEMKVIIGKNDYMQDYIFHADFYDQSESNPQENNESKRIQKYSKSDESETNDKPYDCDSMSSDIIKFIVNEK